MMIKLECFRGVEREGSKFHFQELNQQKCLDTLFSLMKRSAHFTLKGCWFFPENRQLNFRVWHFYKRRTGQTLSKKMKL